ncbi:MAG: nitroreductase family protein [Parcubacteria group bacterium]|jgi:nitroreductase
MDLQKAIEGRHSVRKYSIKKPDWKKIIECLDSVRYAPMAGGNYTLKIILVSDQEKINKLADAAQQPFIATAKYVVVFCSSSSRMTNAFGEKGKVYLRQQAGAAIENFLLKIHEAGMGTCWIGHFTEEEVKAILRIPGDVQVEAIFPIGYEVEKPRTRRAKDELGLRFNTYSQTKMNPIKKLDV